MKPLGNRETGGGLVLPIWAEYMKDVLVDEPPYKRIQPSSVVLINGNYYYADSIDQSVRDVPLNGKVGEKNLDRDILRDQARQVGATFVDPIAERWFFDNPELIGADGIHPTDAGHAYMADKIAPLIGKELPRWI